MVVVRPCDEPFAGCARPQSAERDGAVNAKDNPSATGDGSGNADPTDRQPGVARAVDAVDLWRYIEETAE